MTLLAADVRDRDTTLGLVDDGRVLAHWRVGTDERRTADEWAVLLRALLAGGPRVEVSGVVTGATVPAVLQQWRAMVAAHDPALPHVVVEPGVRTGLKVRVDNPREVGADRIANAVAAAALHGGPAIVVDLGTATTFEVVTAAGEYVGGAIAPGIATSLEALGRAGAQLRSVSLTRPRSVVARNTVEALQSGAVHGSAAQVDGMVARITEALGLSAGEPAVVATGALAPVVIDDCRSVTAHDPWLTLRGLELVFARNTAREAEKA